jgi:prolipoprotein diacylglyceryltransferase
MVDIRIPIGLMFSILGILITFFGLLTRSDAAMYQKSFDINVNIVMGVLMLLFGLVMLYFARKKNKKESFKTTNQ